MTLDEEVAALRAENALVRAGQARIAELEKRQTPAPRLRQGQHRAQRALGAT